MTITKSTLYINGSWLAGTGEIFASDNPSTGQPLWAGPAASQADIEAAVAAANLAQGAWSRVPLDQRAEYLNRFVEVVKGRVDDLALAISQEVGKPLWESKTEIGAVIGKLPPTLDAFKTRDSEVTRQSQGSSLSRTSFRPHGAVAVIGPYNFPAHMSNGHIMPALLAGNTVVLKPSERAPYVAESIAKCWTDVGLPPGVFNLVQGGAAAAGILCDHPSVNAIFFTGSRSVGARLLSNQSLSGRLCALEMGGNSPLVVWDSNNLDGAVYVAIQSSFITTGQRCSAARRLIVNRTRFGDDFLTRLAAVTRSLKCGPYTFSPEPYMGPLRSPQMVESILATQAKLIRQGAIPILEATRLPLGPAFISPGILDVTEIAQRDDEEVFGPLLQVSRVGSFEAALAEANNTQYGLAAGLISDDPELFQEFSRVIKAGIITWNAQLTGASPWAPFGGIKASGNFRPSGYSASDYCVYATGSTEAPSASVPDVVPPGLSF